MTTSFMFCFMFTSCQKDNQISEVEFTSDYFEKRSSVYEAVVFDDLTIDSCCAIVKVRTNVLGPDEGFPIHYVWIYEFGNPAPIDMVAHGGWYGRNWITDNHPDFPHYWIMKYCFGQLGNYCFHVGIVGANVPEPPSFDPTPGSPDRVCFEITDCDIDCADCGLECVDYICWEPLAGCCDVDIVTGLEVELSPGNIVIIPIGPITVNGNYNQIVAAFLAALDALNWGGTFQSSYDDIGEPCIKNGDPTSIVPGFFFINSSIKILKIHGLQQCIKPGEPIGWEPIEKELTRACFPI